MNQVIISSAIEYSTKLIGIPFRWYDPDTDTFNGNDKFWCHNSRPPLVSEIVENDKSIVCTGLINLIRREGGLTIPGLNGNIRGKYKEICQQHPGGTGAWFKYLHQNKRLQKLDIKLRYPKGTLLLAKFISDNEDQGHAAMVYDDSKGKTINEQLIIHSAPTILYPDRHLHKNHGCVIVEEFKISNEEWRYSKKPYYTYVCLPENWLLLD